MDNSKELENLLQRAQQGEVSAQTRLGRAYDTSVQNSVVNNKDDKQALMWYLKAADQGYPLAQMYLAIMYEEGRGGWWTLKSEKQAKQWYQKAAEQGYAPAQTQLGILCERWPSYPKGLHDQEAVQWYQKAAEQGYAPAQMHLGRMYEIGKGSLAQDDEQAVTWYQKAAEQGNTTAQNYLDSLLGKGRGVITFNRIRWQKLKNSRVVDQEGSLVVEEEDIGLMKIETLLSTAQQGNADAQAELGRRYQWGFGVKKDEQQAMHWIRQSAEQGNLYGLYNLAVMYEAGFGSLPKDKAQANHIYQSIVSQKHTVRTFNSAWMAVLGRMYNDGLGGLPKDNKEALFWCQTSAELGYVVGQYNFGCMYENGSGIIQNYKQAVFWYREVADQGYADAQCSLGVMYEKGKGIEQDDKQAAHWYSKAAEQGDARGQCYLGVMYENGKGVVPDNKQAVNWYRKAAEQGDARGECNLGLMYGNGKGVVRDDRQAVDWYRKAAEQGDARGQCCLGLMYENGKGGLVQDDKQAVDWYHKSAEQGYAQGQFSLGLMYENGRGVVRDYKQAMSWFLEAAEQGNVEGQYKLAWMYEKGRYPRADYEGVAQDNDQAVIWYKKAALQGNLNAQLNLGLMYRNLESLSDKLAVHWFRKAAEQGSASGEYHLGWMYEKGRGVSQDDNEAVTWYQKAALQGDATAKKALSVMLKEGRGMWTFKQLEAQQSQSSAENLAKKSQGKQAQGSSDQGYGSGASSKPSNKIGDSPAEIAPQGIEKFKALPVSFSIPYASIILGEELGRGGFGIVYKGKWRHGTVAIKQLQISHLTQATNESFSQEAVVMAQLRFPQIVQLYGVCVDQRPYCMVMEYMIHGSLYSVLHSERDLTWEVRQQIILETAQGLDFLHQEKIVHRDLKSMNVLLGEGMHAKLTDFGLAKTKEEIAAKSASTNPTVGSLLWMAPELLSRDPKYTEQSDIYAYGMTVWEISSRKIPFQNAKNPAMIPAWVIQGERETIPEDAPTSVKRVITWCWKGPIGERPKIMQDVISVLTSSNLQMGAETGYVPRLTSSNNNNGSSY